MFAHPCSSVSSQGEPVWKRQKAVEEQKKAEDEDRRKKKPMDEGTQKQVRSNSSRYNGKELWQLGKEAPMDSSILKAIVAHNCPGVRSPLNTEGTLLKLWHSLLLHDLRII